MIARFGSCATLLLVLVELTWPAGARAGEPNLEQTSSYLSEKVPLYTSNVGIAGSAIYWPSASINCDHCQMKARAEANFVVPAHDIAIDIKSTEPAEASSQGYVRIFASGYRRIAYYLVEQGKRVEHTAGYVEFDNLTGTAETAQRLVRALNHLRKLCGADTRPDPFATR